MVLRSATSHSAVARQSALKAGSVEIDFRRSSENSRSRLWSRSASRRERTGETADMRQNLLEFAGHPTDRERQRKAQRRCASRQTASGAEVRTRKRPPWWRGEPRWPYETCGGPERGEGSPH